MNKTLKIQMALSFAVTLLVGFSLGVYAASVVIGDFVTRELAK